MDMLQAETWVTGKPSSPGWYLLQFSGGDRFVVVQVFWDEEKVFRMEDLDTGAYVADVVRAITSHLPIPKPPNRNGSR